MNKYWKSKKPTGQIFEFQKSFQKSNGQIFKFQKIIPEIKRTNFGNKKNRYKNQTDKVWLSKSNMQDKNQNIALFQ